MARLTLRDLARLHQAGEKITMLTAYDASFARVLDAAGVETLLVGDSLGMVVQGRDSTLAVTLDEVAYHVTCVARGAQRAFLIGDLPFGSYQGGPQQAFASAARLMAAGAQMVKLEGGALMAETVQFLAARGVPVCGHIGLVPQSVHALGGFRVQGRDAAGAARLLEDAKALAAAGASMIVLEAIPAALAQSVTAAVDVPTIGIGAGTHCSGQVLVLHDMLGVSGYEPRFARNFLAGAASVAAAARNYVAAVKDGSFPGPEHCY
ncbi:MAG: 3-methyl-2-oxobutanoate hydroxymethyltransferase [Betaproteobacteria bacterium]|nr:MAG: 3-methyl-2-oxobutanoate hydroxymethyltransferase [Betaproteobacteria bacterium]